MKKKKTVKIKIPKKTKEELEREDLVYEQYYESLLQAEERDKIADKVIEKLILKEKGETEKEELSAEELLERIKKRSS